MIHRVWNTYNEVISASMELSAESRVVLGPSERAALVVQIERLARGGLQIARAEVNDAGYGYVS
jgi:hypothetical protein